MERRNNQVDSQWLAITFPYAQGPFEVAGFFQLVFQLLTSAVKVNIVNIEAKKVYVLVSWREPNAVAWVN